MTRKGNFIKRTEGASAIIIAFSLFALIGMASLAIDMGHLYTVRNELQNVADAAALAGAGRLIKEVKDANGVGYATRDTDAAQAAALQVAQGYTDMTILFGTWDICAGSPSAAWADLGVSNANAVRVSITREAGKAFGPVTSLLAQVFGTPSSIVLAKATAYLGYTLTADPQVPLALPSSGLNSPLASNGRGGWFARLFGPDEAVAATTKTIYFMDTGGSTVTVNSSKKINGGSNGGTVADLDPNQGYWFTAKPGDSVPDTIKNTLAQVYTSGSTVRLGDLKVGTQVYPRSEYGWGRSNIGPIFQNLKYAYNFKTTGNKNTAPAAGTPWHTTLAVHSLLSTSSLPQKTGFMSLARLLAPFWASEAYACTTITYPKIQVSKFVNADITDVKYNSTTSDDGNYTYPYSVATPAPILHNPIAGKPDTTYNDQKDFETRYPNSTWNLNKVTIRNVTDGSTVASAGSGSQSGGPAYTPGAATNAGAFSAVPRLVQ